MKINLTIPRSWNACTTAQLELISDVIREQVERQDRYHPFSMQNVKIALFFALSGIEIVAGPDPRVPVEEQFYLCRLQSHRSPKFRFWSLLRFCISQPFSAGQKSDTFPLYLWQINYWINGSPLDSKGKLKSPSHKGEGRGGALGILDWLDNESGSFLTKFPYPLIKRHRASHFSLFTFYFSHKSFQGPEPELSGFTWSQYRLATEAIQNYMQLSNNLVIMKQRGTFTDEQMLQQAQSVDIAKSYFLATIFNAKTKFVDTSTGMTKFDYHYQNDQITENSPYFRNYPDTQWQVILFWWTGIMHTLSKRYPHVFKVQKVNKNPKPSSALEIYTATIATMQKYVGLNEQECNNQTYSATLEQLERMSKENEELEKIRKKK